MARNFMVTMFQLLRRHAQGSRNGEGIGLVIKGATQVHDQHLLSIIHQALEFPGGDASDPQFAQQPLAMHELVYDVGS